MQKSGCALAATATMLTSIGSLSAISNPAWLDGRLKEVLGYDQVQRCSECITTWCDLDFTLIPSATNNAVQMVGNGQMSVGNIDPFLENHLCRNQERVILRLNETVVGSQFDIDNSSHFVFVTRKTTTATGDTDWEVFDPGWGNADQPGRLSSLKGHLQGFFTFDHGEAIFRIFTIGDARVFKVSSTANNRSALSIRAFSPVELFVRDPQGRGLGNFGQGGADIFDVPDGSYFRDFPLVDDDGIGPTVGGAFDGIKTAYIPSPVTGVYRTQATGIGLGSYTLKFRAVQSNGADQEVIISGVTNVGSSSIYEIVYSPDPSSILTVARVATFQSTLDDISNSLQLGFIDNQGIANSLSSKIRKAADAADRGQRSASRDILGAFKNEVLSQASNHVTGIAPQILLADADSLLMQNL